MSIKSVLVAYKTVEDGRLSIRRCFDIRRRMLSTINQTVSEFPMLTSITLPQIIYNKLNNNDLFAVEWEGNCTNDEDGEFSSSVISANLEDTIYEIIDLNASGNSLPDLLKNGFKVEYNLGDKFYILTGKADQNNKVAIECDKKLFVFSEGTCKLKETYNNKPIIYFNTCLIPKSDIITLDSAITGLKYPRYLYRFTDTLDIAKFGTLNVDDGMKTIINYYKNVLENRKQELGITHREIQGFVSKLLGELKETEDAMEFLIQAEYPYDVAEKAIAASRELLERCLLDNDSNSEFVRRTIIESQEIHDIYYPMIEKQYLEDNKEKTTKYQEELTDAEANLKDINTEVANAKRNLEQINQAIAKTLEKQKEVSKEIQVYDEGLKQKATDYILNSTFLSKYVNCLSQNSSVSEVKMTSNCPHAFISGETVERKQIEFGAFQFAMQELITKCLGISVAERQAFAQCIINTDNLRMNYLINSYHADEFAGFLSAFIGDKTYGKLFIDDTASISSLDSCLNNDVQVILVKNSLKLINTKYIDYLIVKYPKTTFVFEVEYESNLKYLPKSFWKKIFYVYYLNKVSTTPAKNEIYYSVEIKELSTSTKDNIEFIADNLSLDIDNKDYLKENYNDVNQMAKQFSLTKNDKKFNSFYCGQIVLSFSSMGLDMKNLNIVDSPLLQSYVSSLIKE